MMLNPADYENYMETKSHADPSFPYNTYICSIPLDFNAVQIHWHNYMEIIYVKKGKGYVSLKFTKHYVEAGDIIVILPGEIHGIFQYEDFTMEYENILFSIDMFMSKYTESLDNEFFVPLLSEKLDIKKIITRDDSIYGELSECLNKADRICSSFSKGYKLAIKSYFFEFFYILYTNADTVETNIKNRNSLRDIERAKEILSYIQEHYKENLKVYDIASECGFSESHFMRFFKNALGTSFVSYLNDYRLDVSTRLLVSSDDSILDISVDSGFDNLSYFNRIFKKKYGMTPSAYRNARRL